MNIQQIEQVMMEQQAKLSKGRHLSVIIIYAKENMAVGWQCHDALQESKHDVARW